MEGIQSVKLTNHLNDLRHRKYSSCWVHFSKAPLHPPLFLQGCEDHWEGMLLRQTSPGSWPLLEKSLIPMLGRNELRSGSESSSKTNCLYVPRTRGPLLLFLFQWCVYFLRDAIHAQTPLVPSLIHCEDITVGTMTIIYF